LILADVAFSPYIPDNLKFKRDPYLVVLTGSQGVSCDTVCSQQHLTCLESNFQFINSCALLKQYFKCERGCRGSVNGQDVPNYVSGGITNDGNSNAEKAELWGMCLTTEGDSSCGASHYSTSRICPCKKLP